MSFQTDLDIFLQKYSEEIDLPDNLTDREEKIAKKCINILNQAIKKRKKNPKPDRKTKRRAELTEMQKKKFAEKQFVFQKRLRIKMMNLNESCVIFAKVQ